MTLTSDVKQRKQRSQHSRPNPNHSYKTKNKFTGFHTEVNPLEQKTKILAEDNENNTIVNTKEQWQKCDAGQQQHRTQLKAKT